MRFHPRAATDHNGTTTTTTTGAESQVADYREDAVGFFIAKFVKVESSIGADGKAALVRQQ